MRPSGSIGPRIWLLLGDKGGDNAQLRILASALGWHCEEKQLEFNQLYRVPNVFLAATRISLQQAQPELAPPWPDLILASGRRAVPIARWLRNASGGRARLVHVGRTWAPLRWFDLVVAMPQYRVPFAPNVMHALLPLNRLAPAIVAASAERWRPRIAHLPGPYIGVLLGGPAKPLRFGVEEAKSIGVAASRLGRRFNASILASTSRRTPPEVARAFAASLDVSHFLHEWRADSSDNPYAAFLGMADRILVSGDSASMLAEACRTGRPVVAAPLPSSATPLARLEQWLDAALPEDAVAALHRHGLMIADRDMPGLLQSLAQAGHIALLDAPDVPTSPPEDELPEIVARIGNLIAGDIVGQAPGSG